MLKTVITGGAGFIGSHLAEEAVAQGHHVVILDDLSSGKMENIRQLLAYRNVEFVLGTVTDLPLLSRVLEGASYVFHLAAISSVPRSLDDPLETNRVTLGGTLNVLIASRLNRVSRVVYASSAAVYGNSPELPKTEAMVPAPASPYAAAKVAGESYCNAFSCAYGLSTVCLRYFNVYGPRQDYNSQYAAVVSRFVADAILGKAPTIFGDGEQTRDLVYVKDVAAATLLAAQKPLTGAVNLASGVSVSINDLAAIVVRSVGVGLTPMHAPQRPGEVVHSAADIRKAEHAGLHARFSLESGLAETVRWFLEEGERHKPGH